MEPGRRRAPAELWTLESRKERRRCSFSQGRRVALYSAWTEASTASDSPTQQHNQREIVSPHDMLHLSRI